MFFFFNPPATTEIYTLSLHDALPIYPSAVAAGLEEDSGLVGLAGTADMRAVLERSRTARMSAVDRKSTRLNSSHRCISYAVFCLKKKKNQYKITLYNNK